MTGRSLRIALIGQPGEPVTPDGAYSVANWTWQVALRLAEHHEVWVFSSGVGGGPTRVSGVNQQLIRSYPDRQLAALASKVWKSTRQPFFASRLYAAGFYLRVGRALAGQHFDVVHVMTYQNALPTLTRLSPTAQTLLHRHDNGLAELETGLVEPHLRRASLVAGCSEFVLNHIRGSMPGLAERCHRLGNGVDTSLFTPRQPGQSRKTQQLLYVGRLSAEKGIHELLRAFVSLAERRPELRLTLVGPYASLRAEFVRQLMSTTTDAVTRTLKPLLASDYRTFLDSLLPGHLRDRVTFVGPVPNSELPAWYQRADVFVFPSVLPEPFGMPVIEAMACGLPVVATRGGGIVETVAEGETGLLVDRGDPDGLASAIDQLLGSTAERHRMGANGRHRAEQAFTWQTVANRAMALYRHMTRTP